MSCKCYHADRNFLGKIGVCWGTKECEPCSCNGDEAKCDFYDYVRERAKKPITNADRIRAMTDEDLAIFLDDVQKYNICCKPIICDDCADCMTDLCWQCWRDWLKQEVE